MSDSVQTDLNEINIFYRVLREGSFTKAALALGLPKSTVSARVAQLEERLGVRLLERTTRSLRPTEAGAAYFERARRIVAEAEDADAAIADLAHAPRGLVRVFCPMIVARQFMNAVVCEFLRDYPHVQIEMAAADRRFDLLEEGFDLGIHVIGPLDPSYMVRRLGASQRIYVASPEYIAQHGAPKTPAAMRDHSVITTFVDRRVRLHFESNIGDNVEEHDVHARYSVTSLELAIDAAMRGVGIMAGPMILVGEPLRQGTLVQVLPEWHLETSFVSLVTPSTRHLAHRVRLLVDLVVKRFAEVPPWLLEGSLPRQ